MNFLRQPWVIILLLVLVLLLFGANKLPGLARNVGKSMRIFKTEVEELRGDEQKTGPRDDQDDQDEEPRGRRAAARDQDAPRTSSDRREREYDPREDPERESVRAREDRTRADEDSYRRD